MVRRRIVTIVSGGTRLDKCGGHARKSAFGVDGGPAAVKRRGVKGADRRSYPPVDVAKPERVKSD